MDPARLADRLRAIIVPPGGRPGPPVSTATPSTARHLRGLEEALGGAWQEMTAGRCFLVERSAEPTRAHGLETVGRIAAELVASADSASLLAGAASVRPPFTFFDLETTGLNGGAGTLAFLVGCGWFDGSGRFVTRQFVLTRQSDEPVILRAVAAELDRAGSLVSFNGRSFDAPMLETRCSFHRLSWDGDRPHLDVLHPARRFWAVPAGGTPEIDTGRRPSRDSGVAAGRDACSLPALERRLLSYQREDDVSGAEAPARYFEFVRTGDARPLAGVLEHNRQDLLSLAALTARLLRLVRSGHAGTTDAREALALGRIYARAGREIRGACGASARGRNRRLDAAPARRLDVPRRDRGARGRPGGDPPRAGARLAAGARLPGGGRLLAASAR